jgi:eukaryotic-like serine/threonine-protein kinase
MAGDVRVQELVEELVDSGRTPEEVCRACPELLPAVRERLRWLQTCDAQLDILFPPREFLPSAETPSSASVPGANDLPRIPGYEVEELLGRGGMGVVFRARHVRLNRAVAMKMALAGAYSSAVERERFRREAEAVAALRHPGIVQIYDVGDSDGRPFFTMEFIEGGSLSQKLAGTPLPARQAAVLLASLADAVESAHRGGIVHRDLKPANILLTPDGTPKVSDFGIARRLDGEAGLTRTGNVLGTPSYMPPEQAAGQPTAVGPVVDVYALGAILYEMLTGRPPFRAETAAETVQQVINQDPVPPSRLNGKVPRDLEVICLKCLRKEPSSRYATAAALSEDMGRFLRGEAITARPERWYAHLLRRVARRPGITLALTVAAVSFGGGLWLIGERVVAARRVEAELAAKEQAADDDLQEMVRWEGSEAWEQARASLDRAKARLGESGSPEIRRQLDQGDRDLNLAATLENRRLYYGLVSFQKNALTFPESDGAYQTAFREEGLGQETDTPETVAERVKASNIRETLVAALDDWAACVAEDQRRPWMLAVAGLADPTTTPWRKLARDPELWVDNQALSKLIADAPVDIQSVPLVVALQKRFHILGGDPVPYLKRIQTVLPDNHHVNFTLGYLLYLRNQPAEAVGYLRVALVGQSRTSTQPVLSYLGCALRDTGQAEDALETFRQSLRMEPEFARNSNNYQHFVSLLTTLGRHDEAMRYVEIALPRNGNDVGLREVRANCLETKGKYDEALAELLRAARCDPRRLSVQSALQRVALKCNHLAEARGAWANLIAAEPPEHEAWDGYAELSLFLGDEVEYRRVRRALLARFGESKAQVAERTGRACVLAPGTPEEIAGGAALIDRALAADKNDYPEWAYPYFQVAKALAEYRAGRWTSSVAALEGDASRVLLPAPQLILALDLHCLKREDEARAALVKAVLSFDWRPSRAGDREAWMFHVLRREAEGMILPDLPAFLEGKYEPRSNDERLALIGACQSRERFRLAAQLYADAFAADPNLGVDPATRMQFNAARMAALAGCGDEPASNQPADGRVWRTRARAWLRLDLAALSGIVPQNSKFVREELKHWRNEPDLAGLREPAELSKLSAEERNDCRALWEEVDRLFNRKPDAQ